MTPLVAGINSCCCEGNAFSKSTANFLNCALPLVDLIATLACAIIGGLGLASVISMTPAIAYTLVGISSTIFLSWVFFLTSPCIEEKLKDCSKVKTDDLTFN